MALNGHRIGNAEVCSDPKQTLSSVGQRTRIVIRSQSSDAMRGLTISQCTKAVGGDLPRCPDLRAKIFRFVVR